MTASSGKGTDFPKFTDGHVVTQAGPEKGHRGENCKVFYKVIGFFLFSKL